MTTKLKTRQAVQLPVEIAVEPDGLAAHKSAIYNSQHQAIQLGNKIGVGGEGTVYDIQGQPDLVAKIYHAVPTPEKAAKLIAMAKLGTPSLFKIAAWPVDVLRDRPDGNIIGFVMQKIGQAEEVHTLHSPKSRLKKFPDASWSFLLHVAANIARAVAALHEQGFVIGDVNPKNILVTKKATVYLLDCDSFQFASEGKTYRCEGGFPEYTPPELQGLAYNTIDRTQEHDCFGLAVVIFQLLFLGRHPYSGRFLGVGEMPLEQAIQEKRFAYGTDAATRQMQSPPGTLSLNALPTALTDLLCRAFLATERPNAHEWIAPLMQLTSALQRCVLHTGHYYYEALKECPWCKIETRARIRLFNFNLAEARQHASAFRLEEIWAEIEKLQRLDAPGQKVTPVVQLSPEVIKYAQERRLRFWKAFGFSLVTGAGGAWLGGGYAALWLLPLAGFIAKKIADAGILPKGKMQTVFPMQPTIPDNWLADKTQTTQKNAQKIILELEQKLWGQKGGEQAFVEQVNALKGKLETYQNLSRQREHKLKRLESKVYGVALDQHLKQFKIKEAPALLQAKKSLTDIARKKGIKTAADVSEQGLRKLGEPLYYQLRSLLDWRRDLEQSFVFDPAHTCLREARLKVEHELDYLQFQLEHELTSSTQYLRHLRQQLETKQSQLLPALAKAQQIAAQAEKDLEVLSWHNRFMPLLITLCLAFFITFAATTADLSFDNNNTAPSASKILWGFDQFYQEGKKRLAQGDVVLANQYFESAAAHVDFVDWKQSYASLYYDLYETDIRLGKVWHRYRAIWQWRQRDFPPAGFHFQMALLYSLTGTQQEVLPQYQFLRSHAPVLAESLNQVLSEHGRPRFP